MATADVYRLRVQLESVGGRAESERFIESKKKEAVEDRKMSRPVTIFISFLWLGLGAALVSADGAHSISDWDSD